MSEELIRYRNANGDDWADIIDMLTMHPEARRRVVRLSRRDRRQQRLVRVFPAMEITWGNVFATRFVWLDLIVFGVPSLLHVLSWLGVDRHFPDDSEARSAAAESFRSTAVAGITAVGIMIPVTLLVIQLGSSSGSPIPAESLLDVFLADLWLTLSLLFGLYVVWVVAAKSGSRNVYNRLDVGICYGLQLTALFTGVLRLVIAMAAIVERKGP
jgi:hypothetical protein